MKPIASPVPPSPEAAFRPITASEARAIAGTAVSAALVATFALIRAAAHEGSYGVQLPEEDFVDGIAELLRSQYGYRVTHAGDFYEVSWRAPS